MLHLDKIKLLENKLSKQEANHTDSMRRYDEMLAIA